MRSKARGVRDTIVWGPGKIYMEKNQSEQRKLASDAHERDDVEDVEVQLWVLRVGSRHKQILI